MAFAAFTSINPTDARFATAATNTTESATARLGSSLIEWSEHCVGLMGRTVTQTRAAKSVAALSQPRRAAACQGRKNARITPPTRPKARANSTRRRANPPLRTRKPRTADLDFVGVLNGPRSSREQALWFSHAVREHVYKG